MTGWVRAPRLALCAAAVAAGLTGCGTATSGANSTVSASGRTLHVYASEPPGALTAAQSDTVAAEKLALSQAGSKAGNFTITLIPVHERELSANARAAVQDTSTIAYLGELVPGTSQVSAAILNQQGILEISPADTAVYLTQPVSGAGAQSSVPNDFFPTHSTFKQTFARVVPNSTVEAKAIVAEMQAQHATSVYATSDGSRYGVALSIEVRQAAKAAGLTAAASEGQAAAVFYGADTATTTGPAAAARVLDAAASGTRLYAPSGLADPAFVSRLSAAAQQRLTVSEPGLLPKRLSPAGKAFGTAFTQANGHPPAAQAIFGYDAMKALLSVLSSAKGAANQRSTITAGFRSLKNFSGALGTFSITGGDPSLDSIVFAHVRAGQLIPFAAAAPTS